MEPILNTNPQFIYPMANPIPAQPQPYNYQAPQYPYQAPMPVNSYPQVAPTASAVSINIIGPQAYAGSPQPQPQQMYNYAPNPYYSYPNAPIYNVPQNTAFAPPQPVYQPPVAPPQMYPPIAQAPAAPQPPIYPPIPQYNQPPVIIPPATIDQPYPQQQKPAAEIPPAVQQPVPAEPVPTPPPATPAVDVEAINKGLKSENPEEQTSAIQTIAEITKSGSQQAADLLNKDTFGALAGLADKDTSKLKGEQKEKADANKILSMWTLAILQNSLRDAIDSEAKKQAEAQNQPFTPITIGNIPATAVIAKNIQNDSNPLVREAGISTLNYLARPQDVKTLEPVFKLAAKDKNQNVKNTAKQALENLKALESGAGNPAQAAQAAPQAQ